MADVQPPSAVRSDRFVRLPRGPPTGGRHPFITPFGTPWNPFESMTGAVMLTCIAEADHEPTYSE